MNQKQKTMLKRIVAAAIVYIAAAAAKKMNVFAGMPHCRNAEPVGCSGGIKSGSLPEK